MGNVTRTAGAARRPRSETALAVFTGGAAMVHLLGESYYHLTWGQPMLSLLVDIIAFVLLTIAATASLAYRQSSAAGLLAAGWGFGFCLAIRAVSERLAGGEVTHTDPAIVVIILIMAAAIAGLAMLWALSLVWPSPAVQSGAAG